MWTQRCGSAFGFSTFVFDSPPPFLGREWEEGEKRGEERGGKGRGEREKRERGREGEKRMIFI